MNHLSGSFDTSNSEMDGEGLSSSPSPTPSLSSTPSSPQSINSVDFQSIAKIRFLASKWKRRSMSGDCRTSHDLKSIFDNLDKRDDGKGGLEDDDGIRESDVATEAEAIKREAAASRVAQQELDMTASTSSLASSSIDDSDLSSRSSPEIRSYPSKVLKADNHQLAEPKRKGSLLRRAKRALGMSLEIDAPSNDLPSSIFNSSNPDDAIEKLMAAKMIGTDPASVAEFFHTNSSLNKFKIGKYLGALNEFHIKVLHELVKRLDFSMLDFDIALRHLLYCFRLPAEAQQINRIMDAFGSHYFNICTNSVFVNADAAQIMAFSAIMLTTDAHNPRVVEKMTKPQFVTLTRGMNGSGNFPKDFLEYMFEKVVDEPLIRIDHTTTLFPYATKRGWVYIPRRRSWKRYYGVLFEGALYLQRRPMESKWRKRINNIKLLTTELLKIPHSPTQFGVAISGVGEGGVEAAHLFTDSHRDMQGWINVMSEG